MKVEHILISLTERYISTDLMTAVEITNIKEKNQAIVNKKHLDRLMILGKSVCTIYEFCAKL